MNEHGVENTAVVSNPLPPDLVEKLETDEEPSPVDGPRRILSMSRLAAGKGFEQVLDAFELLDIPDVQLDIAGDGSLREMLESRAAASSARDRIHFHGWVSGEQKSELLRRCDCFFLPSRSDSFGMVFVEAMATGRPCVALAHRGVEEVVADGKTGLLIPADESTPQKLAEMVGEVLLNRSTRFQGSVCREHVKEKFSMRAVGDQIGEAIAQIAVLR